MSWTSGYQKVWILFVCFFVLGNIIVTAEKNCKTLGLYEHPTDCTKFYLCTFFGPVLQHCPLGLHFNPKLLVCDWSARSGCYHDKNAGINFPIHPHPKDCTKFYVYAPNEHILMSCPVGLRFNSKIMVCDWPKNVECIIADDSKNEIDESDSSTTRTHQVDLIFGDSTNMHEEPTTRAREEIITTSQNPESSTLNLGAFTSTNANGEAATTAFITSIIPEEYIFNSEHELSTPTTQDSIINESSTLIQNYESGASTLHAATTVTRDKSTDLYSSTETIMPSSTNTTEASTETTDNVSYFTVPNTSPESSNSTNTNICNINIWPHPSDCTKFYMASPIGNVELVCPNNLLFNPTLMICDLAINVECKISVSTESNADSTTQEWTATVADRHETTTILENPASTIINDESTINTNAAGSTIITDINIEYATEAAASTTESSETTTDGLNIETSATTIENIYETTSYDDIIEYDGIIIDADTSLSMNLAKWETTSPNEFSYQLCEGPTWPHSVYCNKFFKCSPEGPVEMSCSEPLLFNPVLEVCDWPDEVKCGEKTNNYDTLMEETTITDLGMLTTEDLRETTTAAQDSEAYSTELNSFVETTFEELIVNSTEFTIPSDPEYITPQTCNGSIWPHPFDCTKFYKCDSMGPIELVCPDNLLFNPKILVCDWSKNVECTPSPGLAKASKRNGDNN